MREKGAVSKEQDGASMLWSSHDELMVKVEGWDAETQ